MNNLNKQGICHIYQLKLDIFSLHYKWDSTKQIMGPPCEEARQKKSWVSSLVTDGLVPVGRAWTLYAVHVVTDGILPL